MNNRELTLRLGIFFPLLLGLNWLHGSDWFLQHVLAPLSLLFARGAAGVLVALGLGVVRDGAHLVVAGQSFGIAGECAGLQVYLYYAAAALVFPTRMLYKAWGLVLGFAATTLLNMLRILAIILVVLPAPGSLWAMHLVGGQAILIVGTLATFTWWAGNESQQRLLPASAAGVMLWAGRFGMGFLLAYAAHFAWLSTAAGDAVVAAIPEHATRIMGLFTEASFQSNIVRAGGGAVRIVPGCTSGPAVVLLGGVIFLLPLAWWKKSLAVAAGYLPAFYLYHVARVIMLTLSMGGSGQEQSFWYNFFGITLALFYAFAVYGYYVCRRLCWFGWGDYLLRLVLAGAIGLALALAVGTLNRMLPIPMICTAVSGQATLIWDTKHALSHMADVMLFVWITLVLLHPRLEMMYKRRLILLGLAAALLHAWAVIAVVQAAELRPMYAALKLWSVALPFLGYFLLFKRRMVTSEAPVSPASSK